MEPSYKKHLVGRSDLFSIKARLAGSDFLDNFVWQSKNVSPFLKPLKDYKNEPNHLEIVQLVNHAYRFSYSLPIKFEVFSYMSSLSFSSKIIFQYHSIKIDKPGCRSGRIIIVSSCGSLAEDFST